MANVRVPVRRRIRPAGWLAIIFALGAAGYAVWELYGDQLRPLLNKVTGETPPARVAAPVHPVSTPPPKVASPKPPLAPPARPAPPSVAPVAAASTPPPATPAPTPKEKMVLAVPPLLHATGLHDALVATSELEAIRLVSEGKASLGITSVVALAAAPESQTKDLQAVRLLGSWPGEAALGPSCDPAKLRKAKLGAVRGSLAHYVLLRLTASFKPPPDISLFDDEPSLTSAYATGLVTGELPLGLRGAVDASSCKPLRDADYTFVAVQRADHPVPAEEIVQVLSPVTEKDLPQAWLSAFVQPGLGGYADVFETGSRTWLGAHVIDTLPKLPAARGIIVAPPVATPPDAGVSAVVSDGGTAAPRPDGGTVTAVPTVDAGLSPAIAPDAGVITPATPAATATKAPPSPAKPVPPQATSKELGFPSWVDR